MKFNHTTISCQSVQKIEFIYYTIKSFNIQHEWCSSYQLIKNVKICSASFSVNLFKWDSNRSFLLYWLPLCPRQKLFSKQIFGQTTKWHFLSIFGGIRIKTILQWSIYLDVHDATYHLPKMWKCKRCKKPVYFGK